MPKLVYINNSHQQESKKILDGILNDSQLSPNVDIHDFMKIRQDH